MSELGWSDFFQEQIAQDEMDLCQMRLSRVHRNRVVGVGVQGAVELALPSEISIQDISVGDWVLCCIEQASVVRCLERYSLLQRGFDALAQSRQLIAANVDWLFIVTSCNADFNIARLERYLALAYDANVVPIILLTKADQSSDAQSYVDKAQELGAQIDVRAIDSHDPRTCDILAPWCLAGKTIAVTGSSGVGKTTLANLLTGGREQTQEIRAHDARGRHTTTRRSLHPVQQGGWLIDTPGMRALGVVQATGGILETFSEISQYESQCKFRDCLHMSEPGCRVRKALEQGEVTVERLRRYQKLVIEDQKSAQTVQDARADLRKKRFKRSGKRR